MARIREEISVIENAVAGQRAIIKPSVGRTWLDCHIEHGGLTLEQIRNIKVILVSPTRTITMWEFRDGVELNEFNKRFKEREVVAGTLSFYFRRPELENEVQAMSGALGTGGLQALRIEFDIETGTTPIIKAWGRKVRNRSVGAGIISYIVSHGKGGNAEGENFFDAIDRRDRIAAIHVLNDGVEALELRVDDATVFKLDRARSEFEERLGGRNPYAGDRGMVIDFMLAGVIDEALVMQGRDKTHKLKYQVREMRLTSTLGTGANQQVRYLVEYHTTWRQLAGTNMAAAV